MRLPSIFFAPTLLYFTSDGALGFQPQSITLRSRRDPVLRSNARSLSYFRLGARKTTEERNGKKKGPGLWFASPVDAKKDSAKEVEDDDDSKVVKTAAATGTTLAAARTATTVATTSGIAATTTATGTATSTATTAAGVAAKDVNKMNVVETGILNLVNISKNTGAATCK